MASAILAPFTATAFCFTRRLAPPLDGAAPTRTMASKTGQERSGLAVKVGTDRATMSGDGGIHVGRPSGEDDTAGPLRGFGVPQPMHPDGERLGQSPLRPPFMRWGLRQGLDLIAGQIGQPAKEAPDVVIGGVQPELVELVGDWFDPDRARPRPFPTCRISSPPSWSAAGR